MTLFRSRISDFIHHYFKVPYTLHVEYFQSPKKPRTTIVFLHGIGNSLHSWDEVIAHLPKDVRLIGVDLLGFGKSPKPKWATYNAKTQALSLGVTLIGLGLVHQPIIVGHSLGALVAVEVAKRYSLLVRRLILCSPPFYQPETMKPGFKRADDILRELYRLVGRHPEQLTRFSPYAVKFKLANSSLTITNETVNYYIATLESSIINQSALDDIVTLKLPIDIFYGTFDPFIIKKHITRLGKAKDSIHVMRLTAGHEIIGRYAKRLAAHISNVVNT